MKISYTNPQKRKGIFIWETEVNFFSIDNFSENSKEGKKKADEKIANVYGERALSVSSQGKEDCFFLWLSEIKEWESQKNVSTTYNKESRKDYKEEENGNLIKIFDFSQDILGKKQVKVNFSFDAYEVFFDIEERKTEEYNRSSFLYRKYTKSERQLSQTEDITDAAKKICKEESGYLRKAKKLYEWIGRNIKCNNSETGRGAIDIFRKKEGNSREVSFLYITMMRSLGIPTRLVTGAQGGGGKRQEMHSWTEFYLEGVGWVPVDLGEKLFGALDNKRVIFSKGENIFLEKSPEKGEEFGINYKRKFFMQPDAIFLDKEEKGFFAVMQNKYLLIKE